MVEEVMKLSMELQKCLLYILSCVALTAAKSTSSNLFNANETGTIDYTEDRDATAVVARVSIALIVVCILVGIYLLWRWTRSKSDVRKRNSGNSYKRVRNSLPTMVERVDDEDEDTLYDRTESTSHF